MRVLRTVFVLVLVCAACVLAIRAPHGVETDLQGLADSPRSGVLREIVRGLSGQGRILLEGDEAESLVVRAQEIAREFRQSTQVDFNEQLKSLDGRTAGLLSPETRAALLAGDFHAVAEASAARLFGLVPPLFSVKRDPFLLGTDWALAAQSHVAEGWTLQDGFPICSRNGRTYLLMTLDLTSTPNARIADFQKRQAAVPALGGADVRVRCCGPAFHSARTAERSKAEINVLSGVSLVCVVLLGWWLFRTFRFVPGLLLAQGTGFLVGTGALFACVPRPHVLTFVFGTSLIGLSVDYFYHARASGDVRRILRPLTFSFLTTVACFAPLLVAEVGILRQMALFTCAGLTGVYGLVTLFPMGGMDVRIEEEGTGRVKGSRRIGLKVLRVVGIVALMAGMVRLRVVNDPSAFYRPDADLVEAEKTLAELSPGYASRFAFVPGRTLQDALENEERLGVKGLSTLIPSLKRQRENVALVAELQRREGSNYAARTGLKLTVGSGDLLDPGELAEGPLKQMVRTMFVGGGLISPISGEIPKGVEIVEPRQALEDIFRQFTRAAFRLLIGSVGVFLLLLACVVRERFVRIAAPVLLAGATTAGTLGWLGAPLTFFTILCFFVLMGIGIDYSIFHQSRSTPRVRRTVRVSFLTSFVGLGLLAFTDFAVTRTMGLAFALGLFFAYVFSFWWRRDASEGEGADGQARGTAVAWHEQREQSAGRLRISFMWTMYAWFGKGVLKILCVPVMAFIYPFAKPAKESLRAFYGVVEGPEARCGAWRLFRHLLGFAWSLADKTDACTLKRNLPRISVRDDAGWQAFQACLGRRKGAFLISTHLGTIEVLPALPAALGTVPVPHVHAFQQMGHDAVFMDMFMRHFDARDLTLHAVEEIGVETAVRMQEAIGRGELVLMAGDRVSAGSAKTLRRTFFGRSCQWPKGVFAFAKLMEAPIFFVTCVRTGWNSYECHFRAMEDAAPAGHAEQLARLVGAYVDFLEEETRAAPEQWYQFYDFFRNVV